LGGRVPFLERVINGNLTRLGRLLRILRFHAHDLNLKPSWTAYMRWGKGPKQRLRFTKTGDPKLEEAYATHFVWPGKTPFHERTTKEASLDRTISDFADHDRPRHLAAARRVASAEQKAALRRLLRARDAGEDMSARMTDHALRIPAALPTGTGAGSTAPPSERRVAVRRPCVCG
jgi:hypothetical protein